MTASLPLFYFKPTVCCIDDDQVLLDAIQFSVISRAHCRTYQSPSVGIQALRDYRSPLATIPFKRELVESDMFGTQHHYPININIPAIQQLSTLATKSNEIAVVVVDYNMPEMNGLEVCEQLKDLPVKKILLTGDVTSEKVIAAFNSGLIDRYLSKNNEINDTIQQYIDELIYQYFAEKTADILSDIQASHLSLLSDAKFIHFFQQWLKNNEIVEYYLINRQGSFLVIDKHGNQSYFVIMSDKDKTDFIQLNDEYPPEIEPHLSQITKGQSIPFFGTEKEPWQIHMSEWPNYFYPSTLLKGRENYYWTRIEK